MCSESFHLKIEKLRKKMQILAVYLCGLTNEIRQ